MKKINKPKDQNDEIKSQAPYVRGQEKTEEESITSSSGTRFQLTLVIG